MKPARFLLAATALITVAACSSGGGTPSASPTHTTSPPKPTHTAAPAATSAAAAPAPTPTTPAVASGPPCPSAQLVGSSLGITVSAPQVTHPAASPPAPLPEGVASTGCSYTAGSSVAVDITLADGVPASYFGDVQQTDNLTLIPPGALGLGKQAGYSTVTYTPTNTPIIMVIAVKNGRLTDVGTSGVPFASAGKVAQLASNVMAG